MGDAELKEFLSLSLDEIGKRYSQFIKNREWTLNRPTKQRAGSFWPRGGYRSLYFASEFVDPMQTKTKKGRKFDEFENFKVSSIGEIASATKCPSLPNKNILYAIYSYQGYAFVSRPCEACLEVGNRNCSCDSHLTTLYFEFKRFVERNKEDILAPFDLELQRTFKLRIATDYGKPVPVGRDQLSPHHYLGCFVPPEDIIIDDQGNLSAAKPDKPGIKDIIRSIFRFNNAPDSTFILPEGDLRGRDLSEILSEREELLGSNSDEEGTSESSDEVKDALRDLEDSLVAGRGGRGRVERNRGITHHSR